MEPFKNLFSLETAKRIASAIKIHYSDFNQAAFLKNIDNDLGPLELKERVAHITERLKAHLPSDTPEAIAILVKALKDEKNNPQGLDNFSVWPLTHFVATYGLDHFDLSLNALKEMTKVFTSEFAIRPFFIKDQKRTLKFMKLMSKDEDPHVRRWASEGSRPLLPWGQKLQAFVLDPEATWEILERLKNDPSEYVRKSVANHLNDHSKNHPDLIIDKLFQWHMAKKKTPALTWVIKHASRSLIKKGFKKAFVLHGVDAVKIKMIDQKILTKKIKIGESLKVKVCFKNMSKKPANFIVDHEMHLLKSNNSRQIKVFKGKKLKLVAGEVVTLEMAIPIKKVTTRVYYSGEQRWNVKINGESHKVLAFNLKVK